MRALRVWAVAWIAMIAANALFVLTFRPGPAVATLAGGAIGLAVGLAAIVILDRRRT